MKLTKKIKFSRSFSIVDLVRPNLTNQTKPKKKENE
jgi:hypothetical protein